MGRDYQFFLRFLFLKFIGQLYSLVRFCFQGKGNTLNDISNINLFSRLLTFSTLIRFSLFLIKQCPEEYMLELY